MSPAELKRLNIEHFQVVLERTANPLERAHIQKLIDDERAKPDSAYPHPDTEPSPLSRRQVG